MSDQNQSNRGGSRGNNKRGRGSNRGSSNRDTRGGGNQNQQRANNDNQAPPTQNKEKPKNTNQDKNTATGNQHQEKPERDNKAPRGNNNKNKPRGNKQDKPKPAQSQAKTENSKEKELKKNGPSVENQKKIIPDPLSGKDVAKAAISEFFAVKTEFVKYLPTENQLDKVEVESTLRVINNDLSHILLTPFHVFWSTVTYNRSLTEFLDSFLRYFRSRNLIGISEEEDEMKPSNATTPVEKQRRQIFIRVWSLIKRLTTLTDDGPEAAWMSEAHYSTLIWKLHLFHIPTLIDIAVHYSNYKRKEIISIFDFLFSVQPKLHKEITQVFGQIKSTVDQLTSNIETVQEVISTPTSVSEDAKQISLPDFKETAEFFSNIFTSLVIFLDLAPIECFFALKNYKIFRDSFVHIYEVVIVKLNSLASKIDENEAMGVRIDIDNLKTAVLQLFSKILSNCFVTPLTKTQSMIEFDEMEAADDYLTLLYQLPTTSNYLRKKLNFPVVKELYPALLIDLEAKIHLRDSLEAIGQALPSLEAYRIKKVIQVIDTHCGARTDKVTHKPTMKVVEQASIANQIPASRLEKIKNLKEIFPDYGEGFLNECLLIYSDDIEKVTDRIFGESLAEPLLAIDRSLPLPGSAPAPAVAAAIPEFSPPAVRRKPEIPTDLSSYQKGKKKMDTSKADLADIKQFNAHYVVENYNDEYDDSMDQYATFGMTEGETNDESTTLTDSGSMIRVPDEEEETPAALNAKAKAKAGGEAHHGPKPNHKTPAHKKKKRFVAKKLAQVPRSNDSQS